MLVLIALAATAASPPAVTLASSRAKGVGYRRMAKPEPAVIYRARGQEPGWMLEIARVPGQAAERATFIYDYGKGRVVELLAPALVGPSGAGRWQSVSRALVMMARNGGCEDVMSGERYPHSVTVTWRGRTFGGCGGPVPAAGEARVGNIEWVVENIGGDGIIDRSRVTIEIREGRVSGRSGCNRYTGGVTLTGNALAMGRLASTMMACGPALMAQERKFLALLEAARQWRINATGALILTAADGRTIVARKA